MIGIRFAWIYIFAVGLFATGCVAFDDMPGHNHGGAHGHGGMHSEH